MLEFFAGFIEGFLEIGLKATGAAIRWVAGGCRKKYGALFDEDTAVNVIIGVVFFALVIGLLVWLLV